jgi:hypothetical protein
LPASCSGSSQPGEGQGLLLELYVLAIGVIAFVVLLFVAIFAALRDL